MSAGYRIMSIEMLPIFIEPGGDELLAVPKKSAHIANVRIDVVGFGEAVQEIVARAMGKSENGYVVTPNAHHVVLLQRDAHFRRIYEDACLVVPDGVPLLWAGNLLGQKLRGRVNGTDLFEALCAVAARQGLRVFLLGGRDHAANDAAAKLRSRNPGLQVCGTYCPDFGFEKDEIENAKIIGLINEARADILFVGLGAPKQEYWMYANRLKLDVKVSLGIGVSFEFVAGMVPRAPVWMRSTGLEWLFRLCSEPKRLWRRYIFGNAAFCGLIMRQYVEDRLDVHPTTRDRSSS